MNGGVGGEGVGGRQVGGVGEGVGHGQGEGGRRYHGGGTQTVGVRQRVTIDPVLVLWSRQRVGLHNRNTFTKKRVIG